MSVSSRILYMKSIIVLLGAIMLLACKNDIKEVKTWNWSIPILPGSNTGYWPRNT